MDDPYIVRLTRDEGRQVMGVIRHGEKGPSRGSGCAPMKLSLTTSQGVPVMVRTALRPLKPSSTRVLRRSASSSSGRRAGLPGRFQWPRASCLRNSSSTVVISDDGG